MVTERKPQPPSPSPPQPVGARPSPRTWRAAYSNNSKQQNNRRNGSRGSIVAVAWFAAVATLAFASIYVSLFCFPDGGGGRRRHLLYYYYGGGSSAAGEGGSDRRRRRKIPTPSSSGDGIEPNYDRINNIAWLLSFPNSVSTVLRSTEVYYYASHRTQPAAAYSAKLKGSSLDETTCRRHLSLSGRSIAQHPNLLLHHSQFFSPPLSHNKHKSINRNDNNNE